MKIISYFNWLLLTARTQKKYMPLFTAKLSSLNKFASFQNAQGISNIPFTNPYRENKVVKLNADLKAPLQIKLPAENHKYVGRIYTGNYPSVTTILKATESKPNYFALLKWRQKQIVNLGKSGYEEKITNIMKDGTSFHKAVKQYLTTGIEPELVESNKGYWKSISHILSNIDQVIALESVVVHPELHYAGTLDGLVSYEEKLCVVDWKTSTRKRTMLKDCFSYPHQIVAYAGAINYDQNYVPLGVCSGLLVLVYSDGSPADTIWMPLETCQYYWNEWLERVELFNQSIEPATLERHPTETQGNKMNDLAQFVGGIPVIKRSLAEDDTTVEIKDGLGTSEWLETGIDILDVDPSVVEFGDGYEYQLEDADSQKE